MIGLTLAQMRLSARRLIPAALAIMLGSAFVALTLIAGNVLTISAHNRATAQQGHADLVVTSAAGTLGLDALARTRQTPGVAHADPMLQAWVRLEHGPKAIDLAFLPSPSDPQLSTLVVSEGRIPDSPGELAVPSAIAGRLGLGLGDVLTVRPAFVDDPARPHKARVVGLVEDPLAAWRDLGGVGMATLDSLSTWREEPELTFDALLVATPDPPTTAAALSTSLGPDAQVGTREEVAATEVNARTDGVDVLGAVVLAFAALALFVAALVITNTFQVLIAQRTRALALLRCIGARPRQLRASVRLEGAILGLVASSAGVLVGVGLAQAALGVLALKSPALPAAVPLDPSVVLAPILLGTVMAVAASLAPARMASRVAPVSALQPAAAPVARSASGRIRLALAVLLVVGGALLLALATLAGLATADSAQTPLVLLVGIVGGGASVVGILLGAVFWMPRVVGWFSVGAKRLGPAGALAAANTGHNPRRTTATSTALLIGVALVVTMSTGAATAQKSADRALDRMSPVDLKVFSLQRDPQTNQPRRIDDEVAPMIGQVPGVAVAVGVPTAIAQTNLGQTVVRGIDVHQAAALLADPRIADALVAGRAVTSEDLAAQGDLTLSSGDRQVTLPTSSAGWDDHETILIPLADLARLAPEAPTTHVWAALDKDADPARVTQDVADSLGATGLAWESRAAERAEAQDQIDDVLAVVLGLLAVAVLIALIGVANTLSLSVVERQRELGTLRALGMTRRQLQESLAVEGVLVAIVGTATGIVLGLAYGWAGSIIVLGPVIGTALAVPWSQLVAVVAITIAAGALASALPARSAARTTPVAALGMQ